MSEEGQAKQESMPPAGEIQESTQAGEEAMAGVYTGRNPADPGSTVNRKPGGQTRKPGPGDSGGLDTQAAQETRAAAGLAEEIQKEAEAAGLVWERRTVYRSV